MKSLFFLSILKMLQHIFQTRLGSIERLLTKLLFRIDAGVAIVIAISRQVKRIHHLMLQHGASISINTEKINVSAIRIERGIKAC